MQMYLKNNRLKMKQEEAIEIFKMRSRMSDVKINLKGNMMILNVNFAKKMKKHRST